MFAARRPARIYERGARSRVLSDYRWRSRSNRGRATGNVSTTGSRRPSLQTVSNPDCNGQVYERSGLGVRRSSDPVEPFAQLDGQRRQAQSRTVSEEPPPHTRATPDPQMESVPQGSAVRRRLTSLAVDVTPLASRENSACSSSARAFLSPGA